MPVTVRPSVKNAESWGRGDLSPELDVRFTHATSAEQLLASTTSDDGPPSRQLAIPELIQTSFTSLDRSSSTTFATKNGFVHACIEAYNEHHNLVLRPEDIWFAILTQLSSYINAHADHLRPQLLNNKNNSSSAQGNVKQALHIETNLSAPNFSHGEMALQMTDLISANLADPSLREWILPSFSTTTGTDQAVASIIFMGTLQKYFTYSWGTRCGIPSVTLLGELDDWIEIAQRCASHLATGKFGEAPMRWYSRILRPILGGFIESFRDPGGKEAKRFWKGIVDRHVPDGSGKVAYSGWITGFCYWDENGRCLHGHEGKGTLVELERGEVPVGFVKVPVTLWDDGVRIETEMVAGSVAIEVLKGEGRSSGRSTPGRHRWEGYDTIQPQSGWFMYRV
ncbi:protein of unknown function (DUF4419) domain containing protein [Naviculisporaceae sp. PSN 640]